MFQESICLSPNPFPLPEFQALSSPKRSPCLQCCFPIIHSPQNSQPERLVKNTDVFETLSSLKLFKSSPFFLRENPTSSTLITKPWVWCCPYCYDSHLFSQNSPSVFQSRFMLPLPLIFLWTDVMAASPTLTFFWLLSYNTSSSNLNVLSPGKLSIPLPRSE